MRAFLSLVLIAVLWMPLRATAQDADAQGANASGQPSVTDVAAQAQPDVAAPPADAQAPQAEPAPAELPLADGTAATPQTDAAAATPAPASPAPIAPIVPASANPDNILTPQTAMEKSLSAQLQYLNPQVNVNNMRSLFLTDWEHDLVNDARLGLNTNESAPIIGGDDTGIREISVGGIVYRSSKDWAVWLNKALVTPKAIPAEIMDIKVYKEYIEIEWFDRSKNLIYPIRLRAHQRFNLDTRMFLPG